MEQRLYTSVARRRRYLPGVLATSLWFIPTLLCTAAMGFFLARDVFSPRFLQPSKLQHDKPHPIRILSPDEASRLSKDQASHVWKDGVRPSDVPALAPNTADARYDDGTSHRRRTRRTPTGTTTKKATTGPITDETVNPINPPDAGSEPESTPPPKATPPANDPAITD